MSDEEAPPEGQRPLPIADTQGRSGREMAILHSSQESIRLAQQRRRERFEALKALGPSKPSELAGRKPASLEDARELNARALGEILLKPRSLRRFERLLLSKEDKTSLAMFSLAFNHILSTKRDDRGEAKPTQVIVNNMVARPGAAPKKDTTTVEVR